MKICLFVSLKSAVLLPYLKIRHNILLFFGCFFFGEGVQFEYDLNRESDWTAVFVTVKYERSMTYKSWKDSFRLQETVWLDFLITILYENWSVHFRYLKSDLSCLHVLTTIKYMLLQWYVTLPVLGHVRYRCWAFNIGVDYS